MSVSRLRYLLNKYLNNECTPFELREFEGLMEQPENEEEVKKIIVDLSGEPGRGKMDEAAAAKVLSNILAGHVRGNPKVIGKRVRSVMGWAAAILLLLSVGFWYFDKQAIEKPLLTTVPDETGDLIVKTGIGERRVVSLPDGSTVWLSPSSGLTYPHSFKKEKREVHLSGEAFFEVEKGAEQPFIIYSGALKTVVIGTSFNIQAYESQENIAVMVVSGKVKVSNESEESDVELFANQRAVFNKKTDKIVKVNAELEEAPGMLKRKEGTFVYHNESLEKIVEDIESYFGVKVTANPSVKDCKVVASFEVSDVPASVLEIIAITIHGHLYSGNGTYIIDGPGCPN